MAPTLEQFKSDNPPPRIVGTEHEYNFQSPIPPETVVNDGRGALDDYDIGAYGHFLSNGAKMYVELGQIEYASPECASGRGVDNAQRAGLIVVNAVIEKAFTKYNLNKEPKDHKTHRGLYDRSVTLNYTNPGEITRTTGYHENYSIPVDYVVQNRIRKYMPGFLATRPIWSGSGYLGRQGYLASQKVWGIGAVEGDFNTRTREGQKPMYLIVQDGAPGNTRRLEIRCMDPMHSPRTSAMALDATSLALRLMETPHIGKLPTLPELKSPKDALTLIARDTAMSQTYELTTGQQLTAVEIQLAFAEAALELGDRISLPVHEQAAAENLHALMESLQKAGEDDLDNFADSIGWIARRQEIVRRLGAGSLQNLTSKAAMLDMLWDRKDRLTLGSDAYAHQLTDEDQAEIKERVATPPPDTRAHVRGNYIYQYAAPRIEGLSWESVKLNGEPKRVFAPDGTDITDSK